jgi:8-oxo-dGTP diphosphatase
MSDFSKYTDYKTILSVNALIWCKGKVLLLKRSKNKNVDPGIYSGVGGKVEPHESFYDALIREIKEETGLTEFESIKPFSITQHPYPPSNAEWVNVYFNVMVNKQVKIPPSEDGSFDWINPKDFNSLPIVADLKEYIGILVKNPKAFIFGFFDNDKSGKLINKVVNVL